MNVPGAGSDKTVGNEIFFYGWFIVGIFFFISILDGGFRYIFTAFLKLLSQEFGWIRAEMSGAFSPYLLSAGLALPLWGWLAKRLGPWFILPIVTTMEQVDRHSYDAQPEAQATKLSRDERSHARLLHTIAGVSLVGLDGGSLVRLEGRHRAITSGSARRRTRRINIDLPREGSA